MTEVRETKDVEAHAAGTAHVRRTPFYFESQGEWLFGWLHQRESATPCQRGVIVCSPLSFEQINAHRAIRHLADAIAISGFPAIRFDYHGVGDSAGIDEDPDRVATWMANLRSAINWMRDQLAVADICLVGLRLGASLAAQIATEVPIADLVLWAPVVKGRSFIREMKAVSALEADPTEANGAIVPEGIIITEQTARDISAVDVTGLHPKCRRALIVNRDDMPTDTKLLNHLEVAGIDAHSLVLPGYPAMMERPSYTKVPHQAIGEIAAWLRNGLNSQTRPAPIGTSAWPNEAVLFSEAGVALCERAVRVCQQPNLFGILCEPATSDAFSKKRPSPPAIILCNGGSHYHTGPGRLHVLISRRLALRGFRCLRMDFHGHGDSITSDPARENQSYPATAFRDIDLAMNFLHREYGERQTILMGFCAGAYAAFQSAAQFTDKELVESILINPLTFYWNDAMTLDKSQAQMFVALQHSMISARKPGKWLDLFAGKSKIGLHGAVRNFIKYCKLRYQARIRGNARRPGLFATHPQKNDLAGDLVRVAKNRRPLTLFLSRSDPGYDILCHFAKSQVKTMCQTGQMQIKFIDKADHNFFRLGPREELLQGLVAHLADRYLHTTG